MGVHLLGTSCGKHAKTIMDELKAHREERALARADMRGAAARARSKRLNHSRTKLLRSPLASVNLAHARINMAT